MLTPRPGCYISHKLGTFGPGDLIPEDHECVARSRSRLMRAPNAPAPPRAATSEAYETRQERATPDPPVLQSPAEDADERERMTIKPSDVGSLDDIL